MHLCPVTGLSHLALARFFTVHSSKFCCSLAGNCGVYLHTTFTMAREGKEIFSRKKEWNKEES